MDLTGLCKSCLGCNRLEQMNFRGVKQCRNYREDCRDGSKQQEKRCSG